MQFSLTGAKNHIDFWNRLTFASAISPWKYLLSRSNLLISRSTLRKFRFPSKSFGCGLNISRLYVFRSDVFGQILPVIGKDWTHSGVAKLYDALKKNGYEFAFLSARAIGQSKVTKDYLKGICQDSLSLPDGPLLLNPSSLLRALHR